MLLTTAILAILPAVILSGQHTPSGWACAPLSNIKASHEDCLGAANYDGATWSISTKKVDGGINRFCVVTLSGAGIGENQDFYVKGTFTTTENIGPYGGISFNMEGTDSGNYVMMRLKNSGASNVEAGRLINKFKSQSEAKVSTTANAAVAAGSATLEILINEGKESVYINGVLQTDISGYQPFYVEPGAVGFAFQNAKDWGLKVSGAEVCSYCVGANGDKYLIGESYQDGLKTCTCNGAGGMECKCGASISCTGGLQPHTDPVTCESKCIRPPGSCSSTGDPHYGSFDNRRFDFHGQCTYQAASCDDFKVYFKNIDFANRAPRYTNRVELHYGGSVFSIGAGNVAKVDDVVVAVPYQKHYNNGDYVQITSNGRLVMDLYSKNRSPYSMRAQIQNYGTWVDAYLSIHGSCDTEGICGTYNGNSADDLGPSGNINTNAEEYKMYDEHCPAPPEPWDPCKDISETARAEALEMCSPLKSAPFAACNGVVDIGDEKEGLWYQCATDVCNCFIDQNCACSSFDTYAEDCIRNGVDLADWQKDIEFCPYDCPAGFTYNARGETPVPTCQDKNPTPTGTGRGCFCPAGQFFQDGECVNANQCKCLYEGVFYNNGQTIRKDVECQECVCEDAGEMTCGDFECPGLNCAADELEARENDECCPKCLSGWVEAVNPEVTVKAGQNIELTCSVKVDGVMLENIKWYKDGEEITKGVSKDRLNLKVKKSEVDDDGTYTCEATKGDVTASDDFDVTVVGPKICEHEDGTTWEEGEEYRPTETIVCTCDQEGNHACECADDGEECEDPNPVAWFNDECVKTCVPDWGHCSAAADPFYRTFDGTEFEFKGDCKYNFFNCGELKMYADHEKDKASSSTKSIDILFKTDTFVMTGNSVSLNGATATIPMHKTYGDGAVLTIENLGNQYVFKIVHDGKDPMIEFKWDKVSSYSVTAHGTCKGFTGGMCGSWDGKANNDFKLPEGKPAKTPEEFGTAWAVDDETDCPEPPEPEDICKDFGLEGDKPGYEKYVQNVLGAKPFKNCDGKIDFAARVDAIVQQICNCVGDLSCACALFDQLADDCTAEGVNCEGWENKNKEHSCKPTCPDNSNYQTGPKPVPSCADPDGGKKTQTACFCPEGQVLVDDKCTDIGDCGCEYAGKLYKIGEKFDKPDECLSCKCKDGGEDCEEIQCKTKCKDDEIEVEVDGECCPKCLGDWLSAVNPDAKGKQGESLDLVCEADVDLDEVRWIRNPGNEDVTDVKKQYEVSKDGLTLTIKKMDAKRTGEYKCVGTKDGKTAEGVFDVTLPIEEADLVEAVDKDVDFVAGQPLKLECKILEPVTEVTWTCNGKVMKSKGNVKINNKKSSTKLVIDPASAEDAGKCTCSAKGVGTEDSDEIEISGEESDVTFKATKDEVECIERSKKSCKISWKITDDAGTKIKDKDVQICKLKAGKPTSCKSSKLKGGAYERKFGRKRKISNSGEYVAVATVNGEEFISDPITLNIVENPNKKNGEDGGKKDKGDKEDDGGKKKKKNKD